MIDQILKYNKNEWRTYSELVKWNNKPTCPCCESNTHYNLSGGTIWSNGHHYKCANCYKKFTVYTGTVFSNHKQSLSNYFMIICDLCGFSDRSTLGYETSGVMTQRSAWMIKDMLSHYFNPALDNPVEQLNYLIKLPIGEYQYPFIIQHTQQVINKINRQSHGKEYSRFAHSVI